MEDHSPPRPRWTISDLIDLEYLLDRKEQTDPEFFEEEVEPWIPTGKLDRPDRSVMSGALWNWLQRQKKTAPDEQLPGRAFAGAQGFLALLFVTGLFLSGCGLLWGLLRYDGRTFNLLLLLGLTLGSQWVLLLLGSVAYLTWGIWRKAPLLSLVHRLLRSASDGLMKRPLGREAAIWWREHSKTSRLVTFPALALSQAGAIAFNFGLILSLVSSVLFLKVHFGWESTTAETMIPQLERLTQFLGAPWHWLRPDWVPTRETIELSQIQWSNGVAIPPATSLGVTWFPFLLLTLIVWGLFPRLLLRGWIGILESRALRSHSFQEAHHRAWWRTLTDLPSLRFEPTGPTDGAVALLWGGMSVSESSLRTACLQQLRLHPEETLSAGGSDVATDQTALRGVSSYAKKHPAHRGILVAEAWSLAPKDLSDFLHSLRQELGSAFPLHVLLVGEPKSSTLFTPPSQEEIGVWERFVADQQDPQLFLHSYQDQFEVPKEEG
ncbi:MAG: DUF2868 domain-containing protein [Verrucomicrobiota bacterium]